MAEVKEGPAERMFSDRTVGNGVQSAREQARIAARTAELAKRVAERKEEQAKEEAVHAAQKREHELRAGALDLGEVRVRLEAAGGVMTYLRLPTPLTEDALATVAKSATALVEASVTHATDKANQARAEADAADAKIEAFKTARNGKR